MRWDELRYLLAASRAGTLAGTARTLGVDQTTVGRTLARLEARLEAKLVSRTRNGLSFSPLAQRLLPVVEEMEQRAYEVERRAAGEDVRLTGTVRVATADIFAEHVLVPKLPAFLDRHPGLSVEVLTGHQVLDLSRRAADVSIRAVRPTQPSLVARKACDIGMALYAADGYLTQRSKPSVADGFRGHVFVGPAEGVTGQETRWVSVHAPAASVGVRVNSMPALVAACATGLGLALLPCFLAEAEPKLRRLPVDVSLRREVWLVMHRDIQRNARVRAFVGFLDTLFEQEGPRLRGEPSAAGNRRRR